jgi:hypothetical protein
MSGKVEIPMSCRALRERLNEAFAAGDSESLSRDTALHLQSCSDCRDYCNAQAKLYEAIDSGVRTLVEDVAPPSLLAGVRGRLAATAPQPNRVWVRALLPSTVALLVASGLLLLIPASKQKTSEIRMASVVPAPQRNADSVAPQSDQLKTREAASGISSSHPAKSHSVLPKPDSPAPRPVPIPVPSPEQVILDPRETAAFAPMAREIAKNPEFGLAAFHKVASTANQAETVEPLTIAKLDIPVLVEEKE